MKKNYFLLFWLFISSGLLAQEPLINSRLQGKVVDSRTQEPVIGATVQISGVTHAVQTDLDGNFFFQTGQKFPYHLIVSFVGYKKKQVTAEASPILISLEEENQLLSELVVIGYGAVQKKDLTGAVGSVSDEYIKSTNTSLERALQGSVAGVNVTQTSGQPGGGVSIRVRGGSSIQGGNEPLYVIDGFPVYNSSVSSGVVSGAATNPLASLNPSDIESITVLKDASSTAIYGSRGANGVVIITTKKGKANETKVSYDFSYGLQSVRKKLDLLDARGFARLRNDALYDTNPSKGRYQYLAEEQIATLGKGTDWQEEAFNTAPVQNHQLSFSGGTRQLRYLVSGNYFNQDGIIRNTGFDRYALRVNLHSDISSKFRVGLNLSGARTDSDIAPSGIVSALISMPPTATIYEPDGSYTLRNPFENIFSNPIAALNERKNQSVSYRVLGTVNGEYDLSEHLTAKVLFGTDLTEGRDNSYLPASIYEGYSVGGEARRGFSSVFNWLNENTLTYTRSFSNRHFLSALAGYTQQSSQRQFVTTGAQQFINDVTTDNSLQSGNVPLTPTSGDSEWTLHSYLGRGNYNFASRYFVTASFRADGSSRFGKNNKWGYFPSAALAWQISNEEFFEAYSRQINTLKLRASYGSTGNQEIGEYQSLSTLTSVKYLFGDQIVTGFTPARIANNNLSWEQTNQFDLGLDLGFLANRLLFTVDLYRKVTRNLLLDVQIPYTTGHTSSLQNYGSVQNQGVELGLNTDFEKGRFGWTGNFNIAFNRNKVLEIGNDARFYTFGNYIVEVGKPLGSFYGAVTDGILQENEIDEKGKYTGNAIPKAGDRLYKDLNNDGAFTTAADRTNIGNALPDFTFGFNNSFQYGNFDLSVLLQGSYGNKILNSNAQTLELFNGQQNASVTANERWTPENPGTTIPRAKLDPAPVFSDRYVEDGSYLRFRNIALGYTLPKSWVSKTTLSSVRFRLVGQNLFTFTRYSGFDPEVTNGTTISPGTDAGIYPVAKTVSAEIGILF